MIKNSQANQFICRLTNELEKNSSGNLLLVSLGVILSKFLSNGQEATQKNANSIAASCVNYLETEGTEHKIDQMSDEEIASLNIQFGGGDSSFGWSVLAQNSQDDKLTEPFFIRFTDRHNRAPATPDGVRADTIAGVNSDRHGDNANYRMETHPYTTSLVKINLDEGLKQDLTQFNLDVLRYTGFSGIDDINPKKIDDFGVRFFTVTDSKWSYAGIRDDLTQNDVNEGKALPVPYLFDTESLADHIPMEEQEDKLRQLLADDKELEKLNHSQLTTEMKRNLVQCYIAYNRQSHKLNSSR